METRTFRAGTAKEVLSRISRELGPDAIIIEQKKTEDSEGQSWVEIVAAPRPDHVIESDEDRVTVAVLPFSDMSPEGDQEYFCDGMAEEILNKLSKVKDLRVVARTSSFSFKGKDVSITEIGHTLNASAVIEGSVRKAGDRLRIGAQLINVADGYHIWSDSYDKNLDDVFAIQDEIAINIVNALKIELGVSERR